MSFRDDHDAALARVQALETEVERERGRADAQSKEAAKLRRERDDLESRVGQLEAGLALAKPELEAPSAPVHGQRRMIEIAAIIVFLFWVVAIDVIETHI